MLLPLLAVIGQTQPPTKRFIVEIQQSPSLPKRSFLIKTYRKKCSDNPSGPADTNGHARLDLPSDNIRQKSNSYEVKTTIIESIFWRWLYATNLLAAVELIFTARVSPLSSTPCSWLPVEAAIAAGWFLKGYGSPYSLLFNPMEQQEARSISRQRDQPVTKIAIMYGSGNNQQPCQQQEQPSESSDQQAPAAPGFSTSVLHSHSGDGNEDPQQQHTLGLNCFVQPCYGICIFRPSSKSMELPECSLNYEDGFAPDSIDTGTTDTTAPAGQASCNVVMVGKTGQLWQCERAFKSAQALCKHKKKDHSQKICDVAVFRKDGQLRPCGMVCKSYKAQLDHKRRFHTGEQICNVTVVGEDHQPRLCGKVCKNAQTLSVHKSKFHSGQKTCNLIAVGEDGQPRRCGAVYKNSGALSDHKRKDHTGQQTCDVNLVGKEGQQQPCGKVCKNASALSVHKSRYHTGQQTCDVNVVGEDGQQQPCGKVYKNACNLSIHKSRYHTGQQNCAMIVVGEDGQQQPCGKICKNAIALSVHKSRHHTRQQTCDVTVVGENSQQQPCGTVCRSAQDLSNHKRIHQKRKPVDVSQNDDLTTPEGKANR
ncbi:hypothetical protein [Endozoicomonas sp. 8E]|uniref:hypothetical protein n=1 Tax=Endozoicomonas sp. 8E TaxID=3035692 RepID=UPI002938E94C|nr:hypothetical protein [Endozoicomonas sp. 8E]WOG27001.1 hypothetical protein P6910_20985 [Endozoicomonas sp. 8E]